MTRTAWIAIVLLLASNAAWWFTRQGDGYRRMAEADARNENERVIDELRAEVAQLRSVPGPAAEAEPAGPGLMGTGTAPMPEAPEDESAPDSTPEPQDDAAKKAAKAAEAERKAALRKIQLEALAEVKAILAKVMQVKDPAVRQEGLNELTAALGSSNTTLVEYSLSALHSMRGVEVDKSVFRDTVLDLVTSDSPGVRRAALYALHSTGAKAGDARFALAGADDEHPLVRMHAVRVLRLYNGGTFDGPAGEALARLLRDEHDHVRKGTVRGLKGATLSEGAEKALVELASNPKDRRDAVQHGLSQLKDKSRRVVDALFTHLSDEDHQIRSHAHQGLQRGIPDAQKPYVAKRYADHLDKFLNPKSHTEALRIIAKFGDASVAPQLDRFADNELVDARVREFARRAADHVRNK